MKYKMEELSIEITYQCPMNCIHCSSRAELGNKTMIPTEKIKEMIGRCKMYCGTKDVSFSGGEPFEHPDFWDLLEFTKSLELRTIIYSCGIQRYTYKGWDGKEQEQFSSFSEERIRKLRGLCDVLIISLHGTADKHNQIMNIGDDAFHSALRTIKRCVDEGFRVETHFVPTKVNFRDVKIVYGICVALGVAKMSILRYVPQGRGLETSKEIGDINLNKKEFEELQYDMRYIRDLPKHLTTEFRIGIPADFTFLIDYIEGDDEARKEKACTGGKTKILVKADGLVQVCPAWKELDHLSAGNIYEEDIVDIWEHGGTYEKFRDFTWKELTEPCKSCIFLHSCLGGCSAQRILNSTMEIDGLKHAPDPLCFYEEIVETKKLFEIEQFFNEYGIKEVGKEQKPKKQKEITQFNPDDIEIPLPKETNAFKRFKRWLWSGSKQV